MRQFISKKFQAPNVIEIDINNPLLAEFSEIYRNLASGWKKTSALGSDDFFSARPNWDSDINWISVNSLRSYEYFLSGFRRMCITQHVEEYVDYEKEIIMYSGFFVTRSVCHQHNFHADWIDAKNDAFTLVTPLSDNASEFGLIYRDVYGELRKYKYSSGKALIFGDHFIHSTDIGSSGSPVALLSFTFGTDKMSRWDDISKTAARQGNMVRRPDGQFLRSAAENY